MMLGWRPAKREPLLSLLINHINAHPNEQTITINHVAYDMICAIILSDPYLGRERVKFTHMKIAGVKVYRGPE